MEIRVINVNSGESRSYKFNEPFENYQTVGIRILDTYDTKVVLQIYVLRDGNKFPQYTPLMVLDWHKGTRKLITDMEYWSVAASFSPDGMTLAVSEITKTTKENIISFIKVPEI